MSREGGPLRDSHPADCWSCGAVTHSSIGEGFESPVELAICHAVPLVPCGNCEGVGLEPVSLDVAAFTGIRDCSSCDGMGVIDPSPPSRFGRAEFDPFEESPLRNPLKFGW